MNTRLHAFIIMVLLLAGLAASAQYTGGNGRGDHMGESGTMQLSGFDAMFSGGSGRGDHMALGSGLQILSSPNPTVTTQAATAIAATSATGNGTITSTNGDDVTNRGLILYPYTNTDKEIGGVDVTNFAETGTFGTGSFTFSLSPLTVNTRYNARAHATNTHGTGYGARVGFWTLANVPGAPTVDNATATSLDVAVNGNANPAITQYAINETSTTNFVQADGTLGATEVWQTATDWGTKTVTGLTTGITYTFQVKARNGDNVETAYSSTTNGTPVAKPEVTTQAATAIAATSATGNGTITSTNGDDVTNRGLILYPYTDTDKEIGGVDVTNFAETGTFGTGSFTFSLSPLTVNTRYNARAHATNTHGTGYGARVGFWTLANVPGAPTVDNPTATSLDVAVNGNANPAITQYAINETSTTNFVQADGTLGATEVWQTAADWGTKTVTGLTTGVTYTFQVKARNGDNVETAYSSTTNGTPVAKPEVTTQAATAIAATSATGNGTITSTNGDDVTNRGLILYPYTDTDKEIGGVDVTNFAETGTFGTGSFTFSLSPLTVNTRYNARAHATNTHGTGYGARVGFWTLANVPGAPTVDNPTATSLDVAVNGNANPAITQYAINETSTTNFVQADGTLGATEVWQTAADWGTKTVTGLTTGVTYTFQVKARNGDNVETVYGAETSRNTCSNPTDGGEINGTQTICYNSLPSELGSITEASNYAGTLQYQWQSSTVSAGTAFSDVVGAISNTYTPAALTQTTWFRRLARVSCAVDWSGAAASNVIEISVNPLTVAGTISGNATVTYGSSTGTLTLSGHTGTILKWQRRFGADGSWVDISNTSAVLNETPTSAGTWFYRAQVQSGVCNPDFSGLHQLVVTRKELIVFNAVADGKVYDGNTDATISGALLDGIVGSDDVFFSALTGVFAQSNAGANIPVTATLSISGAQAGNYSLTQPQGLTATILKAVLTVTALDAAKSYGEVNPPLHFTYSNWVAGIEEIDFEPLLMTAINETTPAGFYPESIIPYGALDNNYSFIYIAGDFSVGPSPLLVVADDTHRTYGAANPVFTVSYFGLKNSDTAPATLPVISTVATIESPTGAYPITASGAADPNYTISYEPGILLISKTPLVITADDKIMCQGQQVPALTLSYAGFVNGETPNVLDQLPYGHTYASSLSEPGTYAIDIWGGADNNYALYFWSGVLTVLAQPQVFAGNDASICVNQSYKLDQASVTAGASLIWTSNGDGTFDNPATLHATYTPGLQDKLNGSVMLTLTAQTQGICQAASQMNLMITPLVTPNVTITATQTVVCSGAMVGFVAEVVNQGITPFYQWKVNGNPVGSYMPSFNYVPQHADIVTVDLTSSLACASPALVTSNAIEINVTQGAITLLSHPQQAGTAAVDGDVVIGSLVTLMANANQGWVFDHWKNAQGTIVSTQASFSYQVQSCSDMLIAHFESAITLAGQLRFFNAAQSPVPVGTAGGRFMAQLFHNGIAASAPQMIGMQHSGMGSTYAFPGLETGKDYTLRLWEAPLANLLSHTWLWNNWGGVTALDALIINLRIVENNVLTFFPWILPAQGAGYTSFFDEVADVNQSNSITALDALITMQRIVSQTEQFMGGRHNFVIGAAHLSEMNAGIFPQAPEKVFTAYGDYNPESPATAHYYEVATGLLQNGLNPMHLYFVAAGDMNASYLPGSNQKHAVDLIYEGNMLAEKNSTIKIPVSVGSAVHLGALTMQISFDNTALHIQSIDGIDIYEINNEKGILKLAWTDLQGRMLQADGHVFTINAVLLKDISEGYRYMELTGINELADVQTRLINGVGLKTKYIGNKSQAGQKLTHLVRPNPFNESAVIQFFLPQEGLVNLRIYDPAGQLVKQYQQASLPAGTNEIRVSSADLHQAGAYYYKLEYHGAAHSENHTGKIVLIK